MLWKGTGDLAKTRERLAEVKKLLENLSAGLFKKEDVKTAVWPYAEKEGRGEVLWPTRVALSGKEKSPDPFISAALIGKEEVLRRIDEALKKLA